MSQLHPQDPGRTAGYRPSSLLGYLALQREADLARAAARPDPAPESPTLVRALFATAGKRARDLPSLAAVTLRHARSGTPQSHQKHPTSPARRGTAQPELACCA